MLIIHDKDAVSIKRAASLADRFQRALEQEAASVGYQLRSFEVQLDRKGSGRSVATDETKPPPATSVPAK